MQTLIHFMEPVEKWPPRTSEAKEPVKRYPYLVGPEE